MPPNTVETRINFRQALQYKQMCVSRTPPGNYGKYKAVCFNFFLLSCGL